MTRIKLFILDKKISKSEILQCMSRWNSNNESELFEISSDNENILMEYKERIVKTEEYEFLDGTVQTIDSVGYFKFQVGFSFVGKGVAYIVNPPREMRYTYELLKSILSDYVKVVPATFDLNVFLREKIDLMKVLGVTISNIQYSNDILAKTTLLSKNDLVEYYYNWIQKYPHSVDAIKLSFDGKIFDINRLGGLKVKDNDLNKLIAIIYSNFGLSN